jgi:acetyl-CoA C-acetyltransferase
MFEAAQRAYHDAGVDPRTEVGSFVCCSEDLLEGTSIFDEYVPDQLGAMQRPVQTVAADGLFGVATGMMLIGSGLASIVAVEAHSKVSDVRTLGAIEAFALDPVLNRPLRFPTHAVAGLDMNAFLERTGLSEEHCAMVAAKNRSNALDNPRAAYPAALAVDDVDDSAPVAWPLRELEVAARADGCVVVVLAAEERARELTEGPVWLLGAGWASGSPTLESRTWGETEPVTTAAESAYRQAEITDPQEEIDLAEVDDTYAYRELQHLEALGLGDAAGLAQLLEEGELEPGGDLPVNVSGGSLGQGSLFEANGLVRLLECVEQLRDEAGERQVDEAYVAVAQSARAVPSTSAAVVVLANDEGAGG